MGTPPTQPSAALAALRTGFASGATWPIPARLALLRHLDAALTAAEGALIQALHDDLGKPEFEAYTSEILPVRQEIRHALRHLKSWAAPRRVATGWFHWPARAALAMEPRGAVLVLSPWNYPVQLSLVPLVHAIAAGNTVLLKPSELAPATAAAMQRMLADFDPEQVQVLPGDAALAEALTALPWDHIFFTGSGRVGRAVAMAAARNLVSCTLELGGCNPCIVDASADPVVTARRIAWGKFLNAGQTCLAPNHVLVHESLLPALLAALKTTLDAFYGADGRGLQRLAHARQFERALGFLRQGSVAHGGGHDAASLHMQPTLLLDVPDEAPALREEIFGPVLPLLPWSDEADLLRRLAAMPEPLAVYLHSREQPFIDAVRRGTRSGALVVNDHLVQATVAELPFGGVGPSGQGRSHGRAGFEAFSNPRSLFRQSPRLDVPLRYPPYGNKLAWVKRLMG
ncbi:aldehyde dehydrogenase (NAD+) [Humitalea rosea]|uniref:Aldehyde dehydrogenase n=1 Tax=Humitalea rosea TaxID=990373 RepID=A0A2W7IUG2_9PROT|nr:aldehyde dehydrogenase family protein [Humitalea rosea]PZW51099.1 aldehyde dehydrogenase (NAD+) [Humitalea rosea]